MFSAFVTSFPWDLVDDELDARLDHLQGEVGATGVTLWAAAPPTTQIRGRDVAPRTTRSRGGLLFHPEERHYSATRIKPIVSSWVKSKHPIERVSAACSQRGMQIRIKVSAALTGRLAQKYPDAACKNLYGAASHTSLCLFNPDVESYVAALLADLKTNHDVKSVSIADFFVGWAEAFDSDLRLGVPFDGALRQVLALCFCESCRQKSTTAGVDVGAARQCAEDVVQSMLDRGTSADVSFAKVIATHPLLGEFHRWRLGELASLLERLSGGSELEILLDRDAHEFSPTLPGICVPDSVAVVTEAAGPEQLDGALCCDAKWNEIRIPASSVSGSRGAELVNLVSRAVEAGFAGVEFDDYGLLPESAFASIKQAIRFGRRSSNE
ncbi:MAG: hypothetical protein IH989_03500 [Planctomycetes bacterium]|nr:hypothetical protein [Planctomycetota bacterium]